MKEMAQTLSSKLHQKIIAYELSVTEDKYMVHIRDAFQKGSVEHGQAAFFLEVLQHTEHIKKEPDHWPKLFKLFCAIIDATPARLSQSPIDWANEEPLHRLLMYMATQNGLAQHARANGGWRVQSSFVRCVSTSSDSGIQKVTFDSQRPSPRLGGS